MSKQSISLARTISEVEFLMYAQSDIIGKKLSNVWCSYGTLFLEFGELVQHPFRDGDGYRLIGEIHFMVEPSWRFVKDGRMCYSDRLSWIDSRNTDAINTFVEWTQGYYGMTVSGLTINVTTLELCVEFDNGICFETFYTSDRRSEGESGGWDIFIYSEHGIRHEESVRLYFTKQGEIRFYDKTGYEKKPLTD